MTQVSHGGNVSICLRQWQHTMKGGHDKIDDDDENGCNNGGGRYVRKTIAVSEEMPG